MSISVNQLSIAIKRRSGEKSYLVEDASFTAPNSKITTIIGPNGAGKSSLLKAIVGDLVYETGHIQINNNPHLLPINTEQARSIAFLPQLSLLNFPFTVQEVVALGRIPHQTGAIVDSQIVHECLNAVNMQDFSLRLYPELSGGEKQRVQIARVLAQIWRAEDCTGHNSNNNYNNSHNINHQNERILILDEPTSSLDLGHQKLLLQFLKNFSQQGVTILMVLHDINTASIYSDSLVAMLNGKIECAGSVKEVLQKHVIDKIFDIDCRVIKDEESGRELIINA